MPVSFQDGTNHTMPVPVDISTRPDLQGTIPIETAPRTSASAPLLQSANGSKQPAGQPNDVAGVLRRNQACLACRRRKLKCDAVRPHCSTCVRSYKHLLRTAPGTQPVLSCEYDDAIDKEPGAEGEHTSPVDEGEEEGKKKRRKTSGARSKKKDEELDVERDRLAQRVRELEAQLAKKAAAIGAAASASSPTTTLQTEARWAAAVAGGGFMGTQAQSPTAFLEMLSSAASSAQTINVPGGPNGLVPLWASADRSESTGLTPFFAMPDPDIPDQTTSTMDTNRSPPTSPAVNMLSPNNVFNFPQSPAPPATLQWAPSVAHPPTPGDLWSTSGTTDRNVQSVLQKAVRDMGMLAGVHQINGSAINGPMMGPAASTPGPLPRSTPHRPSATGSMDMDTQEGETSAPAKAKAYDDALNANSCDAYAAAVAEGTLDPQILLDLFWPGWPPNLPEPSVVTHLVEAFFDTVPNIPRMLHRARFLSRLALPPTHSNFPHPSLLHAICALTATWIQYEGPNASDAPHPAEYGSRAEFMAASGNKANSKPSSMPFSLRQAAYGKDSVLDGLNTGNRLFDVVRAMIILSRVFIDDTRMLECWTYCGLVSRMILPLGLNVRSAELSLKSVMLPPAADALEREERRIVVWMAMYHDTIASAASGWGCSLALDELTVPLPVSAADFDQGQEEMEANPQDLESLDLYIKHPVVDSFVMTLKGAVLLNRVNKFARKWKNRRLRENDDLDGMQRPEFRELANAIACLQMSFPPALLDVAKLDDNKKIDVNTITAHVIPQAAIICLYEPFADIADPMDQSARRILNAARSIINVVQQVVSITANGLANLSAVMHSASSVALVTAARTCLLFYRHALNLGDTPLADSYRSDIETARIALAQYGTRFKIGYHHAQLIEYFLDRATNPTFDKLAAHYPEHPRPGAMVLTPNSNFGLCIMNALNIKRGYWRIPQQPFNQGQPNSVSIHSIHSVSPSGASPNGTTASPLPRQTSMSSSTGSPPTTNNPASVASSASASWPSGTTTGLGGTLHVGLGEIIGMTPHPNAQYSFTDTPNGEGTPPNKGMGPPNGNGSPQFEKLKDQQQQQMWEQA